MTKAYKNTIVKAVQSHYMQDSPPPSAVIVYGDSVSTLEDHDGMYKASIKIQTDFVSSKAHKINIGFKLDKENKIIPTSIIYI